MGRFKETIEHQNILELNEDDVLEIQIQAIQDEIRRVREVIEGFLYRECYHKEPITRANLEFIDSELRRIGADLS